MLITEYVILSYSGGHSGSPKELKIGKKLVKLRKILFLNPLFACYLEKPAIIYFSDVTINALTKKQCFIWHRMETILTAP